MKTLSLVFHQVLIAVNTATLLYIAYYKKKTSKSLAFGSWFTSFSYVLPISRVYHDGKPIEDVVYCLTNKLEKLTLKNSAALSILRKFEILIYIQ